MPVCWVKPCIRAVKLGLSSIVQTWMGPLSVLVDEVFVEPPQPAVHKATATRPRAVMCFLNALFIEPPPRLRSHLTAPVILWPEPVTEPVTANIVLAHQPVKRAAISAPAWLDRFKLRRNSYTPR